MKIIKRRTIALLLLGIIATQQTLADSKTDSLPQSWDNESRSVYDLLSAQMQNADADYRGSVDTLVKFAKSQKNNQLYASAFKALLEVERYGEAVTLVKEWQKHTKMPLHIYTILAQTLNNEPELAIKAIHKQIKPPIEAHDVLADTVPILLRYWYLDRTTDVIGKIYEDFPDNEAVAVTYARQLRWAGRVDEAVKIIDKLLFKDPKNINYLDEKSNCYRYALRLKEAENVWKDALGDYPGDEQIKVAYAEFLFNKYDFQGAEKVLSSVDAKHLDKNFVERFLIWLQLRVAVHLNNYKALDTIYDWENAPARMRDNLAYNLATLLIENKAMDLAKTYLEKIDEEGELALSAALKKAQIDYTDSIDKGNDSMVRLAEKYHLNDSEVVREKANAMQKAGLEKMAYQLLTDYLADNPKNEDIRYMRALVAAEMHHDDQAVEDLKILYNRSPDNEDYQNALGYTLLSNTDDYESAEEMIKKALSEQPGNVPIIDSMGWVLYQQGQYQEALPFFRYAYANYQDGEIIGHYIALLEKIGKKALSKTLYQLEKQYLPNVEKIERYRQ